MKKKLLSLALVLIMALTLLPTAAFADDDTTPPGDTPTILDTTTEPTTPEPTTPEPTTPEPSTPEPTTPEPTTPEPTTPEPTTPEPTTPATCNHVETGGTLTALNTAKAATCAEDGVKAYYLCSVCNHYFIAGNLGAALVAVSEAALKIPATGNHTAPSDGSGDPKNVDTHTYTCTVCETTGITGNHIFSGNVCTVCGFERTVTPTPSRYVDITNAYVNSHSITVTWASNASGGTPFDLYVDGTLRARDITPFKSSSGYFTYTIDFSHYLGDYYYSVAVYLANDHSVYDSTWVYNRYYDHDYYPSYNPTVTPGTNSSGIPYASQVTGRYSASEAIRILRNTNSNNLQRDLMTSNSALSSFESLERAVKNANNVSVSVSIDRNDVPSAFRSGISITGAAFNASRTNSTVRLVVDAPSQTRYTGRGYQFSMTLTGVDNARSLDVPVLVTLPLPSDISSSYVRVLHYHGSNTPTVIQPKVSGKTITFPLTGFSDFVVTDSGPYYEAGGYVWTAGVPTPPRRNLVDDHSQIILPIPVPATPSGYVYDDVPGAHWAAVPIAWAKDNGIMSGYSDGTFRPNDGTTRQELWMVLARLAGANPADMWAARDWAIRAGVSDGSNPNSPLSNQQMIAMLYRYAQYCGFNTAAPSNLGFYRDGAAVSPYARAAMSWAANWGIISADGDGCLNPESAATRADFAAYLYRVIN